MEFGIYYVCHLGICFSLYILCATLQIGVGVSFLKLICLILYLESVFMPLNLMFFLYKGTREGKSQSQVLELTTFDKIKYYFQHIFWCCIPPHLRKTSVIDKKENNEKEEDPKSIKKVFFVLYLIYSHFYFLFCIKGIFFYIKLSLYVIVFFTIYKTFLLFFLNKSPETDVSYDSDSTHYDGINKPNNENVDPPEKKSILKIKTEGYIYFFTFFRCSSLFQCFVELKSYYVI